MASQQLATPEIEALLKQLWKTADMIDRVRRVNAPLVLAQGGPLRLESGYSNPALLDGYNIVRNYLRDVARDHGIDLMQEAD